MVSTGNSNGIAVFSFFVFRDVRQFVFFFQCLSFPSTINQTLQQVKPNSTMLPRSSPGMGLGGVKINTSGPPMRLGLSRNVRVKPLHSHVSVQHWYRNLKKFREPCLFHLHEHLPICQMNFRTTKLNQIKDKVLSWNSPVSHC